MSSQEITLDAAAVTKTSVLDLLRQMALRTRDMWHKGRRLVWMLSREGRDNGIKQHEMQQISLSLPECWTG